MNVDLLVLGKYSTFIEFLVLNWHFIKQFIKKSLRMLFDSVVCPHFTFQ